MINPINNISFQGVYGPKRSKCTKAQLKVINNIKSELKLEKNEQNYLVEPVGSRQIALSKITGMKKEGFGTSQKITYSKREYIGTFDKKHPFKLKNYYEFLERETKDIVGSLAIGILAIGMILGGIFISANKKTTSKPQIEKAMTITKDSVKNLTKDTLNFCK